MDDTVESAKPLASLRYYGFHLFLIRNIGAHDQDFRPQLLQVLHPPDLA
jgi:hypothetical protein